ncbi:MAG: dihydrofolate reductase [Patescibacteria group bacterium]|nr:dihydrofolate reductase [Patescibacteria group bacterium]
MRKIIVQEMISVDGFFAGENGEIDWHNVDAEFNKYAIEFLNTIDSLLFGRITYELMASYWPTEAALNDDQIVASKMNNLSKIVFSKTRNILEWNNSKVFSEINAEEIKKLKQTEGKDIAIFGSGTIVSELTKLRLIDEYRLIVNPIVLGKGKSLFSYIEKRYKLQLVKVEKFKSGNVSLHYSLL